ncbi:MAG: hypothetical protein ACX93P_09570 [Roseovarius sp.]
MAAIEPIPSRPMKTGTWQYGFQSARAVFPIHTGALYQIAFSQALSVIFLLAFDISALLNAAISLYVIMHPLVHHVSKFIIVLDLVMLPEIILILAARKRPR